MVFFTQAILCGSQSSAGIQIWLVRVDGLRPEVCVVRWLVIRWLYSKTYCWILTQISWHVANDLLNNCLHVPRWRVYASGSGIYAIITTMRLGWAMAGSVGKITRPLSLVTLSILTVFLGSNSDRVQSQSHTRLLYEYFRNWNGWCKQIQHFTTAPAAVILWQQRNLPIIVH